MRTVCFFDLPDEPAARVRGGIFLELEARSILAASDEETLAEFRASGGDPAELDECCRRMLAEAIARARRGRG